MFTLESDKITFTFYVIISNSIPNWATFVKEVFWFEVYFRKWWNDCFVTKWKLNFHFSCHILKYLLEKLNSWILAYMGTWEYLRTCILANFNTIILAYFYTCIPTYRVSRKKVYLFKTSTSQAPNITQKKFSTRNESMDILFQKHKFKIV